MDNIEFKKKLMSGKIANPKPWMYKKVVSEEQSKLTWLQLAKKWIREKVNLYRS